MIAEGKHAEENFDPLTYIFFSTKEKKKNPENG